MCPLPCFLMRGDLTVDAIDDAHANTVRSNQQVAVGQFARITSQRIEQIGEVGADVGIGGQQADVLIQPRGLAVVVAGSDVAVTPDRGAFASHHQAGLAMRFQTDETVGHVDARLL